MSNEQSQKPPTAEQIVEGFKAAMDHPESGVPAGSDKDVVLVGMIASWRDAIPSDRKTAADEDFDSRLEKTILDIRSGNAAAAAAFIRDNPVTVASMVVDLSNAG